MAKRKKTLKQKIAADMRHEAYTLDKTYPVLLAPKREETSNLSSKNPSTNFTIATSYLKHDILKTTFLTGIILLFQALLFLMLKNHIVRIPNISY